MQIVIDIPEEDYNFVKKQVADGITNPLKICIANGTPLPKGHGRLIILSEDKVKRNQTPFSFSNQAWISEVGISNATVAIIEADKAESEEQA